MSVLLLRLAGPLQSWGTQSCFNHRDTDRQPSKSGVLGLLCAALGRARSETVDDLAALRMGVRIDREGVVLRDFQTIQGAPSVPGERKKKTLISNRYYLSDARFLVGLEGGTSLLTLLEEALREPVWQLYLGRKSCVPSEPVACSNSLRIDKDLESALSEHPWRPPAGDLKHPQRWPDRLRLITEEQLSATNYTVQDQPLGAAYARRTFGLRGIRTSWISRPPLPEEVRPCSSPA